MPSLVSELPKINENTLVVGYVGDTDANPATGESTTGITYAISKSFDGAKFQIDSNGLLSFREGQAPNFESPTDSDNNGVYRVTVTARDSGGVLTSKTYNVNVADVNENPVAVLDTATVSDTAASDDGVGKLDVLAVAGVLKNDTDPDANSTRTVTSGSFGQNGTQTVVDGKVTLSGTYGTLTLFADGSYQYVANVELDKLQAGSNPVDVFTYTITDNGGLTSSSTLTINLKGANDAAVVAGDAAGSVTEKGGVSNGTAGTATATGHLTSTDVDNTNTFTEVSTATGSVKGYGTFTVASDGTWTYTLNDDNSTVQALKASSDPISDSFVVKTIDGTEKTVIVTINGADDAAVVAGVATGSVTEAGGVSNGTAGTATATGQLTSADVDDANTFQVVSTATTSANGYGTFTVASDGTWTYTLDNTNATVQALNTDSASLSDSFVVKTFDGTTKTVTVTIAGANDAATVSGTIAGSVTEAGGVANGTAGTPTATGQLTSVDVDNDTNFTAVTTATGSVKGYGTFTLTSDGNWTYTLDNSNETVQALKAASNPLTDSFVVHTTDGTEQTVTVTINGADDAAVVAGVATGSVTEAGGVLNGTAGTPTATGQLTSTDVDDANTFTAVATATTSANGYGTFTVASDGTWTYTLDNTNATVQALNTDSAPLSDSFVVTTADGTTKTVTVSIAGANDAAIVTGDAKGTVTEAGGVNDGELNDPAAAGQLISGDVDNLSTFKVVSDADSVKGYGTFTVDSNGEWLYTLDNDNLTIQALNVGDTLTDSFVVTTIDGTEKTVTVTIEGANDAATVSGTSTGSVTEAGGVLNGTAGTPIATGTLTSVDVDNDTSFTAVTTATGSADGYGTFTVASDGTWTYTLNNDNSTVQALNVSGQLTDSFVVETIDGTEKTVTVTIHGTNDAATVTGVAAGSVTEAGGVSNGTAGIATATGQLISTDVDNANTFTEVSTATASANGYGTFTVASDGTWTYTLNDGNSTVQALNVGDKLTDSFVVTTADGTAKTVTVSIAGANDAPVITSSASFSVDENSTVVGAVHVSDTDDTAFTYSILTGGSNGADGGMFAIDASGNLSFKVAPDFEAPTDAGANNGYVVTVQALDSHGGVVTQTVTVTVNDTTPVAANLSGNINENTKDLGSVIAPGGDTSSVTFDIISFGDDDADLFQIDEAGHLSFKTAPNFEAPTDQGGDNTYKVTVQVTDFAGNATPKTYVFTVKDVNEAPVALANVNSAADTSGTDAGVTKLTAPAGTLLANDTDQDAGANGTFTIVSGAAGNGADQALTNGSVTLTGTYGALTLHADGSYEYVANAAFDALHGTDTPTDVFTYTIRDGGNLTASSTLTISLTGTNDLASITGTATGAVTEDATPNSIGGQLAVADADAGEASFKAPASLAGTYGTFTFDTTTGAWTYAHANGTPAVDKLYGGQSVTDRLTVVSSDGTATQDIAVTITGVNDKTVLSAITPASSSVTEAGTATAQDLGAITGTLTFTDLDAGDTLAASIEGTPTLKLNGVALTGSQAATLEAALVDGKLTFGSSVTSNGGEQTLGYSYDAAAANLDFLNADDSLVVSYQVKVGDSDTRTLSFTITGTNDAPTVAAALTVSAVEGAASFTKNLLEGASDLDNGAVLTVTGVTYKVGSADASTTAPAGISLSDHSLTVDPTNAAFDHLKADATETIVVSYEVSDGKVTVAQTETITITGTNDVASITGKATGAVTEDATPNSIGGQLTVADADDGEASFEAPASLAGTYGTFTFDTATGAWTYTLANGTPAVDKLQGGQSVTDQLVVTSFDGTDDQTISVSITGANDKTVLSAITPASSSVTEAGTATAQDLGAITGTLTFTDLDAGDTLAASVVGTPTLTLNGNALTGSQAALLEAALVDGKLTFGSSVTSNGGEQTLGYSYDAAAANLDFLNADDSLVVSYQVKVGDSETRTLSFTITGTNDAPTVAAALTDAADEGAGSVTRNLLEGASDLDNGAVLSVTGVTYKVGSAAASTTIPAGISLSDHTLTVDPTNAAFDHLKAGATETIVVSYEVSDGKVTVAQTETITITGTNDKTILSAITSPASVAELGDASAQDLAAVTGTLSFSDLDVGETLNASIEGSSLKLNGVVLTGAQAELLQTALVDGKLTFGSSVTSNGGEQTLGYTYNAAAADLDFLKATDTLTVSYQVKVGDSDPQTVSFTVTGTQDATTTVADILETSEDSPLVTDAGSGVLFNDADRDGGSELHVIGIRAGTGSTGFSSVSDTTGATVTTSLGTLVIKSDGSYTFTPNSKAQELQEGDANVATFTYQVKDVNDSNALPVTQTLRVIVNGENDASVLDLNGAGSGTGTALTFTENGAAIAIAPVLQLSDIDDAVLSGAVVTLTNAQTSDTLAVSGLPTGMTASTTTVNGVITLTLSGDFSAADYAAALRQVTFQNTSDDPAVTPRGITFAVDDGHGLSPVVTASVSITATNDAATFGGDLIKTLTETNSATDVSTTGTLTSADVDGIANAFTPLVKSGLYGTLTLAEDGSYQYVASSAHDNFADGVVYTDTFTVKAADGTEQSVSFKLTGTNDAPTVAAALTASANEGAPSFTKNLLEGATDVDDGATLSVKSVTYEIGGVTVSAPAGISVSGSTLTVDASNAAFNHLAAGVTETIVVKYEVSDGTATAAQSETIIITGTNDAPTVAAALTISANEGAPSFTKNLLEGATDLDDGATLSVKSVTYEVDGVTVSAPAGISLTGSTLTVDASNAAFNHLAAGATETIVVNYLVSDGTATVAQSETITITGTNDAPTAVADSGSVAQRLSIDGNVLTNDLDVDLGDRLEITSVTSGETTKAPSNGVATLAGAYGTLTLNQDGSYSYLADKEGILAVGQTGTDDFVYVAKDTGGQSTTEHLTITVTGSALGTSGDNTFLLTGTGTSATGLGGDDRYIVDNAADQAIEAANGGTDTVVTSVNYTLKTGQEIERLQSSGSGAFTLTGNEFDNTIIGGDGNDVINGKAGADTMVGGSGADSYFVDNAGDRVIEAGLGGDDTVSVSVSYTLASGQEIETLRALGSTGLTLTGNEVNNKIVGGAGNDILDGKAGADSLIGGLGNDTYYVDQAGDQVTEAVGGGNDTVYASVSYTLKAGQEIETLQSSSTTGVTLTGNEKANAIFGGQGNDIIDGKAGADTLSGGQGNDTYYVDNAGDQVLETSSNGTADAVFTSVSFKLGAGQEIETLTAVGSKGLTLTGNEFANTIVGGGGNDVLIGGLARDVLTGGNGKDTFTFVTLNDSVSGTATRDVITDFKIGTDVVDLSSIDAVSNVLGDQSFTFISGAFTKQAGQLHTIQSGGSTVVEGDVDGNGKADFQIVLKSVVDALHATDFVL